MRLSRCAVRVSCGAALAVAGSPLGAPADVIVTTLGPGGTFQGGGTCPRSASSPDEIPMREYTLQP